MNIIIHLPFPISVNSYYIKGKILSARGRKYKDIVGDACAEQGVHGLSLDGRLMLTVILYPPDKRVRDLDNCLKSLQDAIGRADVWLDDRQIDQLAIFRGITIKGGKAVVLISDGGPIIPDGYSISLL